MNRSEAAAQWAADKNYFEQLGVTLPGVTSYLPDEYARDYRLAMDAQPTLGATDPNSAIPSLFTTFVDPKVFEGLFAPNKAATILGEERRGTWVDDTILFPIVEATGEVSSYDDDSDAGVAGANANWPARQNYRLQINKRYGDLELDRAAQARINWIAQLDKSCALMINKFLNLSYFYGIKGLQNYGLFNDPNLNASLTPALKGYGGTSWYNSSGQIAATANEIFTDIQNTFTQGVTQTAGLVNAESKFKICLSPLSKAALNTTNSFNVNVYKLIKDNYPNAVIVDAIQYAVYSASNPQGNPAGNFLQIIFEDVEGQDTGFCAYAERFKAHRIEVKTSSVRQKISATTWGAVLRMTSTVASMVGI
jgi:hypothetical protein